FWLLAGFCARPGFGAAGDEERARLFARLFAERVVFADNPRVWQQFFIAMRRASGGIDESSQVAMRDAFDPVLAPAEAQLKRSKKWRPLSDDDLLETAASLERVPASRRAELGDWILERTWTNRDPRLWTAISKLAARRIRRGAKTRARDPRIRVAPDAVERARRRARARFRSTSSVSRRAASRDRARDLSLCDRPCRRKLRAPCACRRRCPATSCSRVVVSSRAQARARCRANEMTAEIAWDPAISRQRRSRAIRRP
ncbi:MAG: hypothetical protein ACREJX_10910, partial [Polyangiaceae bacterium]